MKTLRKIIFLLFAMFLSHSAFSQKEQLKFFEVFMDHQWKGHYINSEDSALLHELSWEYGLDSSYVKQTKIVQEVDFKMETYFYWDYELNQISSLSLLNKQMISKGKVFFKENKLMHFYEAYFNGGSNSSKQTFGLDENDQLSDYFYRQKSDDWIEGHFIIYK
jgi:hypothetical protein